MSTVTIGLVHGFVIDMPTNAFHPFRVSFKLRALSVIMWNVHQATEPQWISRLTQQEQCPWDTWLGAAASVVRIPAHAHKHEIYRARQHEHALRVLLFSGTRRNLTVNDSLSSNAMLGTRIGRVCMAKARMCSCEMLTLVKRVVRAGRQQVTSAEQ